MTGEGSFNVPITDAVRVRLVAASKQARVHGLQREFLDALQWLSDRLRSEPATLGEELFDLKALKLTFESAYVFHLRLSSR